MVRHGPHHASTFLRRWQREQARSPEIAKIGIGGKVSREWDGEVHEAECGDGFWIYRGEKYGTLYHVVTAIIGTRPFPRPEAPNFEPKHGSTWSASRFFRLKERAAPRSRTKKVP